MLVKLEDCMNMCTRCFAIKEDEYLPPAQCGIHPRMPLLGAGPVTGG